MRELTERQRADVAFFDRYWTRQVDEGLEWIVPPDEVMFQRDLGRSLRYVLQRMGDLAGMRVLDLGCGTGDYTVVLARRGAWVTAVDLAPVALEVTRRRAERNGVGGRIEVARMPAEALALADGAFDWVVGFGVLHHAQPSALGAEARRVLRPGGRALFREPLGLNPLLEFARRHLPYRYKSRAPGDRFLRHADLQAVAAHFSTVHRRAFYLFSMISRALGKRERFPLLWSLDEGLLQRFPGLWRWCRYVVLEYEV